MRAYFGCLTTFFWSVFALLMLSTLRLANAAEWAAQPSLSAGLEYNDNPQLTTQTHESVHGSTISPRLDLSVSSRIWQIRGGMEASRVRYTGNTNLDRDDQFYNLTTSYRTERSTWQLAGSRSKSSTLAEQQITPDTGAIEVSRTHDLHSISPSWIWEMSELTELQLSYSLTGSSYVNGRSFGLFDYSSRMATAQLTSKIDFKDQVFFTVGHSIFTVPSTSFESQSNIYQAGITRHFSNTLQGTLSAGMRKTSDEGTAVVCTVFFGSSCLQTGHVTGSTEHTSSVFSGGLGKKYETVRLNLDVKRAFEPSGLGTEVQTDSQVLTLNKRITARLDGSLIAGNYSYRSQTGDAAIVKRDQHIFSTSLSWEWTRKSNIGFRYIYTQLNRAIDNQTAASNAVFLTLSYRWTRMAISR